jgi:2-(1,2-epoxy-1,2-dihydrophenyl)acetyl-CoA isomerase
MSLDGNFCGFGVEIAKSGVATLTFNRSERMNGLTPGLKRDLVEWLTLAQLDDQIRVVVITGSGQAFSAGDDISSAAEDDDRQQPTLVRARELANHVPIRLYGLLRLYNQELPRIIRRFDKVTIAAINGVAIQSGLTLALACDLRIAARSARLGSATLRMGYLPDETGHWLLVQHLGVAATLDFVLRQRIVNADRAADLGLVHEVVDDDALLPLAIKLATEIADGPQVALRLAKRAIYSAAESTLEQAGEDVALRAALSDFHPDAIEGLAAFRERRSAHFNTWLESATDTTAGSVG